MKKPVYACDGSRWIEVDSSAFEAAKKRCPSDWWAAYDSEQPYRYNVVIECIAKNEERYIVEWIRHHLCLGIDKIFIYDNNDKPGLGVFLKERLSNAELASIEVIEWRRPMYAQQMDAFYDCLTRCEGEAMWMLSIDVDEFLMLDRPLNDLLRLYSFASLVYFSWKSFGANGLLNYDPRPVMERFTRTFECHDEGQGKVMVRPNRVAQWHIHGAELKKGTKVDALGNPLGLERSFLYEGAWINHYFTKSLEEWVWKIERGSADPLYYRKYKAFFDANPDMMPYYDSGALQEQGHSRDGAKGNTYGKRTLG